MVQSEEEEIVNSPRRRACAALSALAVAAAAACSSTAQTPTPDFGPNGGRPVGMPGMTATASQLPTASSASTASAPVADTAIDITDFAFTPATLTVKTGDTVTWANHDEEPHTVAAADGSFHSPGMGVNATYSFTFSKPGNYGYTCSIHPFMHGTVVVTP
jgi:plastocyanin